MKKIIIITGAGATGKTTKAKELTKDLKTACLSFSTYKKGERRINYSNVSPDTEAIIIEESATITEIIPMYFTNTVIVDKRGFDPFEYKLQLIIFTSNNLTKNDFPANLRIEFIEMKAL